MTLSRPYLIRAIYEWLVDNELTPYVMIDAEYEGVVVPMEHVQDGKIILNINPMAVEQLNLANDGISFSARFSGKAMDIYAPIRGVLAVYSMENGKGMMFPDEEGDVDTSESYNDNIDTPEVTTGNTEKSKSDKKREKPSFLKVVK